MTAVFSISVHPPVPGRGALVKCYAHPERLPGEPRIGTWKSEDYVATIIHELCDPKPEDDPQASRLMVRGTVPPDAIEWFRIFVTPCKTPDGICLVSEFSRIPGCHPSASEAAMELYADIRRWIKFVHRTRAPFSRLSPHEQSRVLRHWHDRIFNQQEIVYEQPQTETPDAAGILPPATDTDTLLSDLLGQRQDR